MKLKELNCTANICWSPKDVYPIYIATGTAAQQLDATFSTSASLDIHSFDLADSASKPRHINTLHTDSRFFCLEWAQYTGKPSGLLVGGSDNGQIFVYDGERLLGSPESAQIHCLTKHTGNIRNVDFNHFQHNLLVSGAGNSEILIWDLNNPTSPMTPGTKQQTADDVLSVKWNWQVQHILGSTFSNRCVIWDLRKNEPVITVGESMSRIKFSLLEWHPEVATQLCVSSEDDHTPVIQMWDLRYATSPTRVLESHQKGVQSISWCRDDSDLLLSCGKDNRVLCWNPNSNVERGEVLCELPCDYQWCFDVKWCPRDPNLFSLASFDGKIAICSLLGGALPPQTPSRVDQSFANAPFGQESQKALEQHDSQPLKKPPKWLMRPCGASFGFGGKLVSFSHDKSNADAPRDVLVSEVITEESLVNQSFELEAALQDGRLLEYCEEKIKRSTGDDVQEMLWRFLQVNFEDEPRIRFLKLLDFDQTELKQKSAAFVSPAASDKTDDQSTEGASSLEASAETDAFDQIAEAVRPPSPLLLNTDEDADGLLTRAILMGDFDTAVELCFADNRQAEALVLAIAGGADLYAKAQKKFFQNSERPITKLMSVVVNRDWLNVVESCSIADWQQALALVLTYAHPDDLSTLCEKLASRMEQSGDANLSGKAAICYTLAGNVDKLVDCCITQTGNDRSSQTLQDIVEKVMVLQKAVQQIKGQSPSVQSPLLIDILTHYAQLLASQGCFGTALHYLQDTSQPQLAILRDRLYHAAGQPLPGIAVPQFPFPKVDVQPPQRRGHLSGGSGGYPSTTPTRRTSGGPATGYPSAPDRRPSGGSIIQQRQRAPSGGGYPPMQAHMPQPVVQQQPQSNQPVFAPRQPIQPRLMQPQVPPAQPPRSVTPQQQGPPPQHAGGPPSGDQAVPTRAGPLQRRYPTKSAYDQGVGMPMQQQVGYATQAQPPMSYTPSQPVQAQPNTFQAGNVPQPQVNLNTGALPPPPTNRVDPTSSSWNDPPPFQSRKPVTAYILPTPITTPVVNPDQPQVPNGQQQYGPPTDMYDPSRYQAPQQPVQPVKQVSPPPVAQPPAEVPVIPSEHQVVSDAFAHLLAMCQGSAAHPHIKRKLDDVSRKLDVLNDRLRYGQLSDSVVIGLHQMVHSMQQRDYATVLAIHTQMVGQGNFSEISPFMPGLKSLIQTANQMQLFIQ